MSPKSPLTLLHSDRHLKQNWCRHESVKHLFLQRLLRQIAHLTSPEGDCEFLSLSSSDEVSSNGDFNRSGVAGQLSVRSGVAGQADIVFDDDSIFVAIFWKIKIKILRKKSTKKSEGDFSTQVSPGKWH
jgi:hypothetical protein